MSEAVRITAADCNLALGWDKMFDGSPFSVSPWPSWLIEAIKEQRVWPHIRGSTDYAQWDVQTASGAVTAGPGDWIIYRENVPLEVRPTPPEEGQD